jgi:hypothetical protein
MRNVPLLGRATVCCAVIASACGGGPRFRGPLASTANAVLQQGLECTDVDHWPEVRGEPPFRDCRGTVADTSLLVLSEASDTALLVVKKWPATADGATAYKSLLTDLETMHGPGVAVPPPTEDNVDRKMVTWSLDGYQLSLRFMPFEGMLYLSWTLEPPGG